jgi:hypothetical protein
VEKGGEISMQKWKKNSVSCAMIEEWFRLECILKTKILEMIHSTNYMKKERNAKRDMVIVRVQ